MDSAAYIRVSSKTQTFETQRDAIERAAAARGDTITCWYSERKSAKTIDRLELQRLRADVRAGTVKRVYTFKLDRVCRSGVSDVFAFVADLRRAGCTLIAIADNVMIVPGTDDVTSEVLLFAFGLAARLERAAINERIAAARERVEAGGGHWGRPRRVDSDLLERARAMRAEGRSIRQVSAALKVPRATLGRALAFGDAQA